MLRRWLAVYVPLSPGAWFQELTESPLDLIADAAQTVLG